MATTDVSDRNRIAAIVLGVLFVIAIVFLVRTLRSHPQFGPDEEVMKTVDALFTAINCKDKQRLSDCEQRLKAFRKSGSLPINAANQLDTIIKRAESGQWEASVRTLYDFILAQRGNP